VTTDDAIVFVGVVALAASCVVLLALFLRALRSEPDAEPGPGRARHSTVRTSRLRQLCTEGRSVVELTTVRTPGEPGSGLSLNQLGHVESRLDLLIAQLHEAEIGAPSPRVAQLLRRASVEAENLTSLVQTERRLRLTSLHPSTALLDATALQLSKARTSLDQALRDVSQSITELE